MKYNFRKKKTYLVHQGKNITSPLMIMQKLARLGLRRDRYITGINFGHKDNKAGYCQI